MKYVEIAKATLFVIAGCGLSSAFWQPEVSGRVLDLILFGFAGVIAVVLDWMES